MSTVRTTLSLYTLLVGNAYYVALRAMECHCAWLPRLSESHRKIATGQRIGRLGIAIERLAPRLLDLAGHDRPAGVRSVESRIAVLATAITESDIVAAQHELDRLLRGALEALLEVPVTGYRQVIDEPSRIVAREVLRLLEGLATPGTSVDVDEETVLYSSSAFIPSLPARPAREAGVNERTARGPGLRQLLLSARGRAQILHDICMNIELTAMEVCAANIVMYRDTPVAFWTDMARQVWDEARHAQGCLARCDELGGVSVGRFYSLALWERWSRGETLVQRLCIEQVVQEGNALDSVVNLAKAFRDVGDVESADMLDFFANDEERHTRMGNRWVMHFLDNDPTAYAEAVAHAAELIETGIPGAAPVAREARLRGGFPPSFVTSIEERQRRDTTSRLRASRERVGTALRDAVEIFDRCLTDPMSRSAGGVAWKAAVEGLFDARTRTAFASLARSSGGDIDIGGVYAALAKLRTEAASQGKDAAALVRAARDACACVADAVNAQEHEHMPGNAGLSPKTCATSLTPCDR